MTSHGKKCNNKINETFEEITWVERTPIMSEIARRNAAYARFRFLLRPCVNILMGRKCPPDLGSLEPTLDFYCLGRAVKRRNKNGK